MIDERTGTMYDPAVTEAFVKVHQAIAADVGKQDNDASTFTALLHPPPPPPAVALTGTGSSETSAALLALSDLAAEIAGHTPSRTWPWPWDRASARPCRAI